MPKGFRYESGNGIAELHCIVTLATTVNTQWEKEMGRRKEGKTKTSSGFKRKADFQKVTEWEREGEAGKPEA